MTTVPYKLTALAILAALIGGCAFSYTRSTEICNAPAAPACASVKDSAGLELERR